ncbi:MAG TPA: glycosyltransferase family 39 protein [Bacteroidales bacterium]|nr:glycosyltransferase family 39 protein [Bacteroidales bacterium]
MTPLSKDKGLFWIIVIASAGFLFHLFTYNTLGFHRDEFLYLSLGKHLSAGYWSNPPLIGLVSYLAQLLPFGPLFSIRLVSAIAGFLLVLLTGLIVGELGGGIYSKILACLVLSTTLLFLRAYSMLQPVPFDILLWTAILYFLLKYINTENHIWLLWLGVGFGLGMLNKYMVVFLAAGIFIGLLLSPKRKVLADKYTWIAAGIAILLFLPNILWQYNHGFPVTKHMIELRDTQLVNVKRIDIVIDQVLMFTFGSFLWIAGLIWLLARKTNARFRIFAIIYLSILVFFLILKGKSYYLAGLYPFLFAAGAVSWEKTIRSAIWRTVFLVGLVAFSIPMVPAGIPLASGPKLASYFSKMPPKMGAEALLRWEDGKMHTLPQDFADMIGWDELAGIVIKAADTVQDKSRIFIYGENYGQAGSVDLYGRGHGLPQAMSFSDSYILWMPDTLSANADLFFYINDERGDDVFPMFERVDSLGSITDTLAREYGTTVYLCQRPSREFRDFLRSKVSEIKGERVRGKR